MNTISQMKSAGKNVFYGWWVVAAGSFLYALLVLIALSGFTFLLVRRPKPPVRLTGAELIVDETPLLD